MKKTLVHLLFTLLFVNNIFANPDSPTVISGNVHVEQNDQILNITASNRAIIHWDSFSIGAEETTRFNLPTENAAVLNRVTSQSASVIQGLLSSNGNVYLINRNGVMITPSGRVDMPGFLASTLDISDQDFLQAGDLLFKGDSNAALINQGIISCWDGDAILIAYQIVNEKEIRAPKGTVALAAGREILLIPEGKQKISVRLKVAEVSDEIGIHQKGFIRAVQEELKADGNLYSYAIKNEGTIKAEGYIRREGKIFLVAEEGLVINSGSLKADLYEQGGEIHILGKRVALTDEAKIDVSGITGGGTVLIGGDYQGKNPDILNAEMVFVEPKVSIVADGLENGNGGKVILWSDKWTYYNGNISAKGGEICGDGGFVEISSLECLDFSGPVSTLAPYGNTGTLLLDPSNVNISTGGNANMTFGGGAPPAPYATAVPTGAGTGVINIIDLQTSLGANNVAIASGPLGAQNGDITLLNNLTYATNTLTLNCFRNFTINNATTLSLTGSASLIVNAGTSTAGVITITSSTGTITTAGTGSVALNVTGAAGVNSLVLNGLINHAATGTFTGTVLTAGNISGGANLAIACTGSAGSMSFTTQAGSITFASGSTMTTSSGNFTLNARDGDLSVLGNFTANAGSGNVLFETTTAIAATTGDVTTQLITFGAGTTGTLTVDAIGNVIISTDITYNSTGAISFRARNGFLRQNKSSALNPRTVQINTSAPLTLQADVGDVQIFNRIRNSSTGNISVIVGRDLQVGYTDLIQPDTKVQLGSRLGNLTLQVARDVIVFAGRPIDAYAQIGYDDATQVGGINSNITFTQLGRNLIMTGGFRDYTYSVIGHGVHSSTGGAGGTIQGNITFPNPIGGSVLMAGANFSPTTTVGQHSFVQIGHLNSLSGSTTTATGNIDISHVTGSITMVGGNRADTYALIGHGGGSSPQADTFSGSIQVGTGNGMDINLTSGLATETFAAIGHTAFNSGGGTVTINNTPLIEVISGGSISLFAQQYGARIGAVVVSTAGGSGAISVTNTHVKTNTGDLLMTGTNPVGGFNNAFIGAISYTGVAPIVAAGSASTNLLIESAGLIKMLTGIGGGTTTNFTLIQNGIQPIGGPFSTTITTGASLALFGGNNISEIHSIGPLTITCGDVLTLGANPTIPSFGDALIISTGTTSITADSIFMLGTNGGAKAAIENSLQNLTLTAANNITVVNHADIQLTGGSGNLNVTSTTGSLSVISDAFISNIGTGDTNITVAETGFIQGGVNGSGLITSAGKLTASFSNNLFVTSINGGSGKILSAGDTNITSTNGGIFAIGESGFPAVIQNSTGLFTARAQTISFESFTNFGLTGGSGTLTVTTTVGDLYLGLNSTVQNSGSGSTVVDVNASILINADVSGASGIGSNSGLDVTADQIFVLGVSSSQGFITAGQNNLTILSENITIGPNGLVSLTGGSGTLGITLDQDLFIFNNSILSNLGTGPTTIAASVVNLTAGVNNASIVTGTGAFTMNLTSNLRLVSNIGGSASITSSGTQTITAANITLGGLASGQQSVIQNTSASSDSLITAQLNITMSDNALMQNTGTGQLTLIVDNAVPYPGIGPGRFIFDPDAQLVTSGGTNLRIFTARPNGIATGNMAFGIANGLRVTNVPGVTCPFDAPLPSIYYKYNSTYPDPFGGAPFTIFFKQP